MLEMITTWDGSIGRALSEIGAHCPWVPAGYVPTQTARGRRPASATPPKRRRRSAESMTRALLLEHLDDQKRSSVELAARIGQSVVRVAHTLHLMTHEGETTRVRTTRKKHAALYLYRRGPAAPASPSQESSR